MGEIVTKTSEEIRKEWPPERVAAHLSRKDIPEFDPEEMGYKPGLSRKYGQPVFLFAEIYSAYMVFLI